jgi:hypothetical protein
MFAAKDRPPQDAAVSSRPVTFTHPTRISSNLRRESQTPPSVFNRLPTLLPEQKFQHLYFHSLPHSLQYDQNVTPVFPTRSALFLRSCAQERKSTPLFSCACARFCRHVGVAKPVLCCARLTTRRRAGRSRLATSWKRDSARMLHQTLNSNNQPSQEAPWKDDNF